MQFHARRLRPGCGVGDEMFPMEMKKVGDLAVNRDETLTLPRRFEAHHPPLSSQRQMRIFCAVVQALVRAMLDTRHQFSFGGGVRAQLVGHHDARGGTLIFEELKHQPKSRTLVPVALQQSFENVAAGIDGAPQPYFPALIARPSHRWCHLSAK